MFALGHYRFVPSVGLFLRKEGEGLMGILANIIERIVHRPSKKAKDRLRSWLKVHSMRMLLVDIPAVAYFIGDFVHLI